MNRKGSDDDNNHNHEEEDDDGKEEWEDVMGSGAIMKKVIKKGKGQRPEFKQQVEVHIIGKMVIEDLKEKIFQNTYEEGKGPKSFFVGEQIMEEVVPGLNLIAKMMKPGEICDCKVASRFAYADTGSKEFGVPPNKDLEYRVELISVGDFLKEPGEMNIRDSLARAKKLKARGKEFYENGDNARAMRSWKEAMRFVDSAVATEEKDTTEEPETKKQMVSEFYDISIACTNNIAAALEKEGKLKEAKEACVSVLEADPNNLKALLRAARIATTQGLYDEASTALKLALTLYPNDEQVRNAVKAYQAKKKEYEQNMKKNYGGFLDKAAPTQAFDEKKKKIMAMAGTSSVVTSSRESLNDDITTTNSSLKDVLKSLEDDSKKLQEKEKSTFEEIDEEIMKDTNLDLKAFLVLLIPTIITCFMIVIFGNMPADIHSIDDDNNNNNNQDAPRIEDGSVTEL